MVRELHAYSATQIQQDVRTGNVRAQEFIDASLARIGAVNDKLGAYVEVFDEQAKQRATAIDQAVARGDDPGPLAGVPVALKDNYVRRGQRTSCASKILDGFVSPYSATAVQRLEDAGAIIIGRTNMDEFGMGSSTEHSIYGCTKNPFDVQRTPGGSSGGSAAAVAARTVPLALGSDTGGSVRQPASLCGITGLKPTYGRISRFGLVAYASSLDTVAPFAHDIGDLALLLSTLAGVDPHDATSLDAPLDDYASAAEPGSLAGLRVGVPAEYFAEGLEPQVEELCRAAIGQLETLGATAVPVSLPHTRYAVPAYYLIAPSEASANLSRYDGVKYGLRSSGDQDLEHMYQETRGDGFGSEVALRVLLGAFCLCSGYYDAYYLKATKVRTLIRNDFDQAFQKCDVLAAPTSPVTAFQIGEKLDDPLAMYLCDALTTPASLAGIPGLSVPCGQSPDGLPVGLQLLGPALSEARLLRVAAAYQDTTAHHLQEPQL